MNQQGLHQFRDHCHHQISKQDYIIQQSTQPPTPTHPAQPQPSQLRCSARVRADPAVWRQNWFKANYKPSSGVQPQPTIQPSPDHAPDDSAQPHDYRNPSPLVEDSESDHESQHPPSSDSESSSESVLIATDPGCYFTLPEALEVAYQSVAKSDYPKSYSDAMTRPDAQFYHNAACDEIQSLIGSGTWEVAQLPPGRKAIGCRWVFVIKHKSDGSVDRYKARLVAQGFSQRPGLDYGETYAATVKWATLRAILALGALEDLEIESVDISSAFLNGEIDAEVYMHQPEGFPQGPNISCGSWLTQRSKFT